MEKPKLVKRGIYKKDAQKLSHNNTITTRLQSAQEKIGQLREIKPTEKFLHEDLRPRLRKSMLVRAVKNSETNIISSTPHPTKTQNNNQFFGNNLSILLSPISLGRLSNNENNIINKEKNRVQNDVSQKNNQDESSEILISKDEHKSQLDLLEKHNSSVIYVSSDNDHDRQNPRTSLRKSKKDQSTNRSKIGKKLNNEIKRELKKLNSDKSFVSRESSPLKERNLEKLLPKSPVELQPEQQTGVKKSRIPLRTASQEKEKDLEHNHSLRKQAKFVTRAKSGTPKKTELSVENLNIQQENKTLSSKKPKEREKRRSASTPFKNLNREIISLQENAKINLNGLSKKLETNRSESMPNKNVYNMQNEDKDAASAKGENTQVNKNMLTHGINENVDFLPKRRETRSVSEKQRSPIIVESNMIEKRAVSLKSPKTSEQQDKQTSDFKENEKASRDQNDNEEHITPISSNGSSKNKKLGEHVIDQLDHDKTLFINKTPRRHNNTLTLHKHSPVLNKDSTIHVVVTEARSPNEKVDIINKSRPSVVRCNPAEKSELVLKSIAFSSSIGGNKRHETQILQHTTSEKSVQLAEESLNNSNRLMTLRSSRVSLNESVARLKKSNIDCSPQKNKIVENGEDNNQDAINRLVAEISAKKNERLLDRRPRRTVNREIQTSMINGPKYSYEQVKRAQCRLPASRFTEQMTQTSFEKPKCALTDKDNTDSHSSASSYGGATDILRNAYYFEAGYSRTKHNIYESLEQGNDLDALDFSESDNTEPSVVCNQTRPNRPWRYIDDGLVPQNTDSVHLSFIPTENEIRKRHSGNRLSFIQSQQNSVGYSCGSSDDSGHSSSSLKNDTLSSSFGNASVGKISNGTALSKTARRQYNKKSKKMEDLSHPARETVFPAKQTMPTNTVSRKRLRSATVSKEKKLFLQSIQTSNTEVKSQKAPEIQVHEKCEAGTSSKKRFVSKVINEPKTINKHLFSVSTSSLSTENLAMSSADKKLLGVRPLSDPSSHNNIESEYFNIDIQGKVNSRKKQFQYSKKQSDDIDIENNIEEVLNLEECCDRQSVPKFPNNDLESSNKKKHIDQDKSNENVSCVNRQSPAKDKSNENASCVNRQSAVNDNKTKRMKKQATNNYKPRLLGCAIDQNNILQVDGGGRPQRNRRPVRCMTDIIIDDVINVDRKKRTKKRTSNNNIQTSKKGKKSAENDAIPKKRAKSTKGKSKPIAPDKELAKKIDENPRLPDTQINQSNTDKEIMPQPNGENKINSPPTESQENMTGNSGFEIIHTLNKSLRINNVETNIGQSSTENESMPPPNGINLIYKTRNRMNITGIPPSETRNNTYKIISTGSTTRKRRGRKKKSEQNKQQDEEPEQSSFTQPVVLPIHENNEIAYSPNRISVTDQFLTTIRTGGVTKSHEKQNLAKDLVVKVSRALEKSSESSRDLEKSVGFSDENNGMTFDSTTSGKRNFEFTNDDYISYLVDGELYSLRYINKNPPDGDYKSFGNLDVTQTVKYPRDNFSAGYIRLRPGDRKRPTITTRYSFVYTVVSGSAWVKCHNRTGTVQQGDFLVIPVGMEYSIQNINLQSNLVLSYIKIRTDSR